jgi:hypothetical protein
LGCNCQLFELQIANRNDVCQERAHCLFYCLHDQSEPDLRSGFAITVSEGFLNGNNQISRTDLRGARSRYLTIYSPCNTMLHFSSIKLLGLPG